MAKKIKKADAKNAIDTRCLFLTTDQALTSFQREDHEAKNTAPVVIAPSQLLQMFAFSTTDSGYEETFIKFFASSLMIFICFVRLFSSTDNCAKYAIFF